MDLNDYKKKFAPLPKEVIEDYNNKPEYKDRGLKIVEEEELIKLHKSKRRAIYFGIFIALIIALAFATFVYLAYTDKLNLVHVPPINIPECPAVPACPTCPAVPSCPVCPVCPTNNFTCSPILKCGNST